MAPVASPTGPLRRAGALARSCHPLPTAAVTCFALVLAAAAGNGPATCTVLAVAVLAGQLSIGWSNDRIDAARDRAEGRRDKPLAIGEVRLREVDAAVGVALAGTVAFSLALGWRAGLVHLGAVGCGWAYNAWLKSTIMSWLPYAVAFGALPAVATLALPTHPGPATWVVGAGALVGVTANLTNALPDLAGDRLAGIVGLPHRLGAPASLVLAAVLLAGATALVVFGPPGRAGPTGWAASGVSGLALLAAVVLARRAPAGRGPFYGIVAVVALDLAVVVVAGQHLR